MYLVNIPINCDKFHRTKDKTQLIEELRAFDADRVFLNFETVLDGHVLLYDSEAYLSYRSKDGEVGFCFRLPIFVPSSMGTEIPPRSTDAFGLPPSSDSGGDEDADPFYAEERDRWLLSICQISLKWKVVFTFSSNPPIHSPIIATRQM